MLSGKAVWREIELTIHRIKRDGGLVVHVMVCDDEWDAICSAFSLKAPHWVEWDDRKGHRVIVYRSAV